ncbi:DUF4405 domain-containing protein [Halorhodospira abdelmalekii]|uniref:DUF4405 domain-containing protein n=1 Tax=Halorhodospira abdelmalekii TaxID=421629 RepID=UPI003084515F
MIEIAASIPGRLRLRGPQLHRAATLSRLQEALQQLDPVVELRGNPKAGSLVVYYTPESHPCAAMEREVLETAARLWDAPDSAATTEEGARARRCTTAPSSPRPRRAARRKARPLRMVANRYAKQVMLVSLAVVMVTGVFRTPGWRYWHTVTGWTFAAALIVHLYVYRRHLVR